MHDIRQKYNRIKKKVEENVFDSYLLKYIERPIIDEDKLLILVSMLDQLNLADHVIENKVLSTMLIQIALDTHEYITISSRDEKSRQLIVLAGDYYSGLYYKFLANSEDILMIKVLSEGVKEVNEQKISVYHCEFKDMDKLMNSIMLIESSLLVKFGEHFKVGFWADFIKNLLFFKRLLHEKSLYTQKKYSILFEGIENILLPINESSPADISSDKQKQIIKVCDHYLDLSKQVIERDCSKLSCRNELLENRIQTLLNQHQPYVKTIVEEG